MMFRLAWSGMAAPAGYRQRVAARVGRLPARIDKISIVDNFFLDR
jgi:hypothetical protein